MNLENNFDYEVICRSSAEMLKYIFDRCNIPVMYLNPGGQNSDNIICIE